MSVRREMREHARDAIAFVDEIEGMSRLDDVTGLSVGSIARSMFDRTARAGALAGRRGHAHG